MKEQLGLALGPLPAAPRGSHLEHYHVRAHVAPHEALAGEMRAETQEDRILAYFRAHAGRWTPWAVADALGLCINSVRRSCTNLTARGLLVHHPGDRRPAGPYGQRSGTWSAV